MRGSCRCGAVSYEISRLDSLGHCHCITCRKTHSAAFATTGRVARENFRWLTGEDKLASYESSPGKKRFFCSVCGCHMSPRATNPPTYFCERQRSTTTRVFDPNGTSGARMRRRGSLTTRTYPRIRSGRRRNERHERNT